MFLFFLLACILCMHVCVFKSVWVGAKMMLLGHCLSLDVAAICCCCFTVLVVLAADELLMKMDDERCL